MICQGYIIHEFEEVDLKVQKRDPDRGVRIGHIHRQKHNGAAGSVPPFPRRLMTLRIIKDDRLFGYIQEEYEKCLSIKNFIHNKMRTHSEQGIKKWGNKQASKWKKR